MMLNFSGRLGGLTSVFTDFEKYTSLKQTFSGQLSQSPLLHFLPSFDFRCVKIQLTMLVVFQKKRN